MTELAAPAAKRLQRPSWRDSRLLVGVLLVLLAATLGAKTVASADDRAPVFVAAVDLVAGDQVDAASLRRVDVKLDEGVTRYVSAGAAVPEGRMLLRDLRAGELVPESALGAVADLDLQRVTVKADAVATTGLARGSRVDVFVTPKATLSGPSAGAPPKTTKVLEAAGVAAVLQSSGGFGNSATTSVQIYVPRASVQTIVESVNADARLTLVPVAGTTTAHIS